MFIFKLMVSESKPEPQTLLKPHDFFMVQSIYVF